MAAVRQAEYARRHGVSRKTITMWKQRGWLVFDGDLVDVEKSDALLARYRRDGAGAAAPVTEAVTRSGNDGRNACRVEVRDDETPAQAAARVVVALGADMDMDEARRVKENYLALLNQLEYETKSGALVSVETARRVIFSGARGFRDALMHWPGRIAPVLAAELDVDADRVSALLDAHVNKLLSSLSDPPNEFSGP